MAFTSLGSLSISVFLFQLVIVVYMYAQMQSTGATKTEDYTGTILIIFGIAFTIVGLLLLGLVLFHLFLKTK